MGSSPASTCSNRSASTGPDRPSSAAPSPQQPFFADHSLATAYDAAKPKIDLDDPDNSRLVVRLRDEFLFVPIHHQIRPWAMKPSVSTLHRSNDYFEARYTTVK